MSKKLKVLILINVVLLAAVVASLTISPERETTIESNMLFETATIDAIQKITIDGQEISLENRRWKVNNDYNARPSKINTLLGILSRLEVKRSVQQNVEAIIKNAEAAFELAAYNTEGQQQFSFTIGSSGSEIWLQKQGEGNLRYVYVPGFFFELADYFKVTKDKWRDRKILQTNWQSLKSLEVTYTGDPENSFKILFDSVFYKVEGVNSIDSAAVYNYITLYENFEVAGFIEEASIRDSLAQTTPLCSVTVKDIKPSMGGKLSIYPGPQRVYGKLEQEDEIVMLDPRMLGTYLVNREFFMRR